MTWDSDNNSCALPITALIIFISVVMSDLCATFISGSFIAYKETPWSAGKFKRAVTLLITSEYICIHDSTVSAKAGIFPEP